MNISGIESEASRSPGVPPMTTAYRSMCGRKILYAAHALAASGRDCRDDAKVELAKSLLDSLSKDVPCGSHPIGVDGTLRLEKSPLGKPHIRIGEFWGPSIGFSHSGGLMWAAVCSGPEEIGLDVASGGEFTEPYPFHRILNEQESAFADVITRGDKSESAALIWTAKESYVKALGCGFYLFDPIQVRIEGLEARRGTALFRVSLSEEALERLHSFSTKRTLEEKFCEAEPSKIIEYGNCMAYVETRQLGVVWFSVAIL